MNSLQLATTLVTPTGTGLLFGPYGQDGDKAEWFYGTGTSRQKISLSRVRPKPTATFAGVERFEMKRTQYFTVNGVEYTVVASANVSMPVAVAFADRQEVAKGFAFMTNVDGTLNYTNPFLYAVVNGAIPT